MICRWLFAISLCAGPALAARSVPAPDAPVEPAIPAARRDAVEALYRELRAIEEDYAAAIDGLAAGEEVVGETAVAEASERLRAAARRCVRLVGCATERFLDAQERLLGRQQIALVAQASSRLGLEAELDQLRPDDDPVAREPGTSSFAAELPPPGRAPSLLRGAELRELIQLNGPVRAALDDWLTWMRPMLVESYENYLFLRAEIAPIYEQAGIPEALLFAMMATETGGKVHAQSHAGAAGPLQFMRRTGQRYGLEVVGGFDQRYDPVAATRAAVEYLNERFAELGGSLEKALAAYNGGESRVERLHRRLGGKSFWDPAFYYALPTETREYVPRILAAAWLFLHPDEYNLEFPEHDAQTVTLAVRAEIALSELAVCLGQRGNERGWFRTLRNLNPRLKPGDRVAAGETLRLPATLVPLYEEQCLDGEALALAREIHEARYPAEPEVTRYIVQASDTLGKIASRHDCISLRELAALNDVRPPGYTIHVGQEIKVPRCD